MKRATLLAFYALWLLLHPSAHASNSVPVLRVNDSINIGVKNYLERGLHEAKASGAPAVLVELDTPGGFLDATRGIVQLFLASEIPVIVWVTPAGAHAASAGSMIAMSAHYAAMAASTSIGAATPISADGKQMTKELQAKIENDTLAFVDGIAEKRGRNRDWARDSVAKAASLNASAALKERVIDGVHESREEVWRGARAKFPELPETADFKSFPRSAKERLLGFVSDPNIAYGLLALGGMGLYLEMSHPGTVVPGAVGALALVMGGITMGIVPIRPGAVALLVLGFGLLAIELLTALPTFGVAGAAGVASIFLSGLFLLDPSQTDLTISASFWLPSFFAITGLMIFIGLQASRALRAKGYAQGFDGLMGQDAEIVSTSEAAGLKVRLKGEIWDARWLDASVHSPENAHVQVVAREGFTLIVKGR